MQSLTSQEKEDPGALPVLSNIKSGRVSAVGLMKISYPGWEDWNIVCHSCNLIPHIYTTFSLHFYPGTPTLCPKLLDGWPK